MKLSVVIFFILLAVVFSDEERGRKIEQARSRSILDWIASIIGTTQKPITVTPSDPPDNCPPCQCGLARTRRRIVGGNETRVLEFPWMALLLYNGRFYCGGALINDLYVLTAAHCTTGLSPTRMSVRLMEHDRSIDNETEPITRKIAWIRPHGRYNPGTYDNDIAILKLNKRVDLSQAIRRDSNNETDSDDSRLRPVCLAPALKSFSNDTGHVIGWGALQESGAVSETLQEVKVPILSNEDCRKTAYGTRITANMLCAGFPEGGKDACQGDSGGPLHVIDDDIYHEVGVVSWGEGCARPDRPGVYTRVNRYLTWIKNNTKDACYCQ